LTVIIDSFAWIEFLGGTHLEPAIREVLIAADVVATPDLVLAEVARKLARVGIGRSNATHKLQDISTLSQVVPISVEIALGVAAADEELRRNAKSRGLEKPGLTDSVILSTAKVLQGKVLTGDRHFNGLPDTIWLGP
jgi:predicted nucleic acid-binding protein